MDVLSSTDFEVSTCQATIYTPDEDISSAKVMKKLYPKWADIFDNDPEVIPPLPAFPAEIPRVKLRNKSNTMSFEFATARANFFWRKTKKDQPVIQLDSFYQEAIRLFSECHQLLGCRVGRLAAVISRFAKKENPGVFLARHFCKEKWNEIPLNRPQNFELHAYKQFPLNDKLMVNSWVRSKTGSFETKDEKNPIILVEQDINTLAEEVNNSDFQPEEIEGFFQKVIPEFDLILSLYYPGERGA